jgi:hypothetical protein
VLEALQASEDLRFFIISSREVAQLKKIIVDNKLDKIIEVSYFVALLIRVLLDCAFRGLVSSELVGLIGLYLAPEKARLNEIAYVSGHFLEIYTKIVDDIFSRNLQNTPRTRDELVDRFHNFINLGPKGWYKSNNSIYSPHKALKSNAIELHENFEGVTHIAAKVLLDTPFDLSELLDTALLDNLT